MTKRVTEDDVIDVLMVEDPDGTVSNRIRRTLSSAIDAANALVDKVVALDADEAAVLTSSLSTQMEKYLAAHFAQVFAANQQVRSESSLGASATFQGSSGQGLRSTDAGLAALLMDVSGQLQALSEGVVTVGVEWLGMEPTSQTDYEDRR